MKFAYDKYILPDWVRTMEDYRRHCMGHYEQGPSIQSEPPPMERLEIEHRMAQIAAKKAEMGHVPQEYNASETRHSTGIYRCRGNGSRRGGFGVSRE